MGGNNGRISSLVAILESGITAKFLICIYIFLPDRILALFFFSTEGISKKKKKMSLIPERKKKNVAEGGKMLNTVLIIH